MSEKLTLEANIPEEIALKFPDGLEIAERQVNGQTYSAQVMFTLTDDRKWYTSPVVAEMIRKEQIVRGERFRVCKRVTGSGPKSTTRYQITRLNPPAEQPKLPTPVAQRAVTSKGDATSTDANPRQSNRTTPLIPQDEMLAAQLTASIAIAKANGNGNGHNGNGYHDAPPVFPDDPGPEESSQPSAISSQPAPLAPHAPWLLTGSGQRYLDCYTHAVDLLQAVKKYAHECGWDVIFTAEDLRCTANTLCINQSRGERQ